MLTKHFSFVCVTSELSCQGQQVLPLLGVSQISLVNIARLIVLIGSGAFVLSSASAQPFSNVRIMSFPGNHNPKHVKLESRAVATLFILCF